MKYHFIKLLLLFGTAGDGFQALSQLNMKINTQLDQKFNIQQKAGDAIKRLSQSIRFPTVSYNDTTTTRFESYIAFIEFLKQNYPLVDQHLERKIMAGQRYFSYAHFIFRSL